MKKYDLYSKVADFYKETFPKDKMKDKICTHIIFLDLLTCLLFFNEDDVYRLIKAKDPVVRVRLSGALAEMINVEYKTIYDMWLSPKISSLQ